MTNPQPARSNQPRQRPTGWPVGSFTTYAEAQAAVDRLSDEKFPVEKLSIVGVDLVEVEKVTGRLTWGKVIGGGAASGAWMGIFFGLLFGILGGPLLGALLWGIVIGAIFGIIFAAVPYGVSGGDRDFTSHTQIVAGRYDVLCAPDHATRARDMIAQMGVALRHSPQEDPAPRPEEGDDGQGR
ncbi:hypothetical protein B841_05350 [Corynebacterium maris DSM 45190]|uniref:General stress protein 17M-like domain-containing protein n=1 Tax=Corynebacterium maris DSM 45190 TaxID=1224163 RepID=S5TIK5_9CORY|nr:general stress protein [Corynebacterium maris]AGS34543.1 hypothetical protein B841_05350 [Corynebacterium maris DSM 45190]